MTERADTETSRAQAVPAPRGPRPSHLPRWLRAHWRDWLVVLFVAFGVANVSPYFEKIYSANELSRLYLAEALVRDGAVDIGGPLKRYGPVPDYARRAGKTYSDKAPGVSFVSAPAVAVYRAVSDAPNLRGMMLAARFTASVLPTWFILVALALVLQERVKSGVVRRAALVAYGFGSLGFTYGVLLFGHQLAAAVLFGLYVLIRRVDPDDTRLSSRARQAAVGFFAASAVVVEYPNAVYLLPLGFYYLFQTRARPTALLTAVLGMLPPVLALLAYHDAAFGSPWATGYSFLGNKHFAAVHAKGFMGVALPKLNHVWLSFFSPAKGMLYYTPFLAFALPALLAWRTGSPNARRERLFVRIQVVVFALFVVSMVFPHGGWTVSQRHLTPLAPWLVVPAAIALDRWPHLRGPGAVAAAFGVIVTGISTVVWPYYFGDLKNPFFQFGWPAFRDGWLPPSWLNAVGLSTKTGVGLIGFTALALIFAAALSPARADAGESDVETSPKPRAETPEHTAANILPRRTRALNIAALVLLPLALLGASRIGKDQHKPKHRQRLERDYEPGPYAKPVRLHPAPKR